MKKFFGFSILKRIKLASLVGFAETLNAAITAADLATTGLSKSWEFVLGKFTVLDAAYKKDKQLEKTAEVEMWVSKLSRCVSEILGLIRTFQWDEDDIKAAADRLRFATKKFKGYHRLDYVQKLGDATELLKTLNLATHLADITTLNLGYLVTRLETIVNTLKGLNMEHAGEKKTRHNAKKGREAAVDYVNTLKLWAEDTQAVYRLNLNDASPNAAKITACEHFIDYTNNLVYELDQRYGGEAGEDTDNGHQEAPEPNPGGGNGGNSGGNNGGDNKPPNPESPD
jgi:hypothetical protein